MQEWAQSLGRPRRNLVTLFLAWKFILLVVALCSPGPGYDTSASLDTSSHDKELPVVLHYLNNKLIRWDAFYFTKAANRGYLFEQEWAFGWGFTRLIALCTTALTYLGLPQYNGIEGVVASCIALLSHLASVLVLFSLTLEVLRSSVEFAFIAASLHIISPAGIFLSAPYAESSCALLSFAGILLFSRSLDYNGKSPFTQNVYLLLSGLTFGIAATFRSNAVLNGLLLLGEAFRTFFSLANGMEMTKILRLLVTGASGLLVGAGFLLPQYIAYREFCGADAQARSWCQETLPSIYTFVQGYYWNCGLFRYWTVSNIPLFLLGAPMFAILTTSGLWALRLNGDKRQSPSSKKSGLAKPKMMSSMIVSNLAVQQLILVALILTTAHVQIISRLASAFPTWMWYGSELCQGKDKISRKVLVRFMVIYAIVQDGLYASFLPPA